MINDLIIENWFPTTIGVCDYPYYMINKDKWLEYILSKPTRNGFGGDDYQPHNDKKMFGELNDWITKQVNIYAQRHKFAYEYEAKESWFIDYQPYDFNPWHCHTGYTISTIFYLQGNPKEVKTQFKNPVADMKNPQNKMVKNDRHDTELYNEYTYHSCSYDTIPGRLLIFRSHTEHCTTQNTFDDKRIVFSYNFDPKIKIKDTE
jgi:uncharacterized protein (TIGR02466 family)